MKRFKKRRYPKPRIVPYIPRKSKRMSFAYFLSKKEKEKGEKETDNNKNKKQKSFLEISKNKGMIDYKNIVLLRQYITAEGKIIPRRVTRITAKQQRSMANAIKIGRILGFVPFAKKLEKSDLEKSFFEKNSSKKMNSKKSNRRRF